MAVNQYYQYFLNPKMKIIQKNLNLLWQIKALNRHYKKWIYKTIDLLFYFHIMHGA